MVWEDQIVLVVYEASMIRITIFPRILRRKFISNTTLTSKVVRSPILVIMTLTSNARTFEVFLERNHSDSVPPVSLVLMLITN